MCAKRVGRGAPPSPRPICASEAGHIIVIFFAPFSIFLSAVPSMNSALKKNKKKVPREEEEEGS